MFVSLDSSSVPPVSELRSEFRQHLRTIDLKVIQLFALVSEDLSVATRALLNGDAGALKVVAEREEAVDGLYRELEALVTSQLVLQAPVAADFRFLLSVLRIVPELERSHDLVVHIAEHATHILDDDLSPRAHAAYYSRWVTPPVTCGPELLSPGMSGTQTRCRNSRSATTTSRASTRP